MLKKGWKKKLTGCQRKNVVVEVAGLLWTRCDQEWAAVNAELQQKGSLKGLNKVAG